VRAREGGFDYLLDQWALTVRLVEKGYPRLFDEYLADLDTRQMIDELATYASDEEWADVEAVLPLLDERFLKATRRVECCVWGEHNAAKYGWRVDREWWYYRLPTDVSRVLDPEYWPESSA
jgi:hypothetical protein